MAIHDPFKIRTAEGDLEASRVTIRYQQGRIDKLLAENEELKTRLGHAVREHNEVSCEITELKAAQTPRPMESAPRKPLLLQHAAWGWMERSPTGTDDWIDKYCNRLPSAAFSGWLPLPVDQGGKS